jgi:hypothetical protein
MENDIQAVQKRAAPRESARMGKKKRRGGRGGDKRY